MSDEPASGSPAADGPVASRSPSSSRSSSSSSSSSSSASASRQQQQQQQQQRGVDGDDVLVTVPGKQAPPSLSLAPDAGDVYPVSGDGSSPAAAAAAAWPRGEPATSNSVGSDALEVGMSAEGMRQLRVAARSDLELGARRTHAGADGGRSALAALAAGMRPRGGSMTLGAGDSHAPIRRAMTADAMVERTSADAHGGSSSQYDVFLRPGARDPAAAGARMRSSTWASPGMRNAELRLAAEANRIAAAMALSGEGGLAPKVGPSSASGVTVSRAARTRTLYQELRAAERLPEVVLTPREKCQIVLIALGCAVFLSLFVIGSVLLVRSKPEWGSARAVSVAQPYRGRIAATPLNLVEVRLELAPLPSGDASYNMTLELQAGTGTNFTTLATLHRTTPQSGGRRVVLSTLTPLSTYPEWTAQALAGNLSLLVSTTSPTPVPFELTVVQNNEWGHAQLPLAVIVLVIVYGLLIVEVLHRMVVAMIGSFLSIGLLITFGKSPSLVAVASYIDYGTLALLFGTMIVVSQLTKTGFFEFLSVFAFKLSGGRMWRLTLILSLGAGFVSFFLSNVTTMLLVAPVTIKIAKLANVDPRPIIMCEVMLTNIGGTATLIGDPSNVILATGIPSLGFVDFLANQAVGVIITTPPLVFLLWLFFRKQLSITVELDVKQLKEDNPIRDKYLFAKSGLILITVVIGFFLQSLHQQPVAWVALLGAFGMMILSAPHEVERSIEAVEWATLIFFACLFVMIECMVQLGLIEAIGNGLGSVVMMAPLSAQLVVAIVLILWVSSFASAFLANIPFMATMVPVILAMQASSGLSLRALSWALSYGGNLGGNGTLVGAACNIVAGSICEKAGYPITFKEFIKVGFPFMIANTVLVTVFMLVVYVGIGIGL